MLTKPSEPCFSDSFTVRISRRIFSKLTQWLFNTFFSRQYQPLVCLFRISKTQVLFSFVLSAVVQKDTFELNGIKTSDEKKMPDPF